MPLNVIITYYIQKVFKITFKSKILNEVVAERGHKVSSKLLIIVLFIDLNLLL